MSDAKFNALLANPEFKAFLSDQLRIASLSKKSIDEILQDLNEWARCFTHKTFDSARNYETFEFYGDKIVSSTASNYIKLVYGHKISTPVWLTKIYHHIISSRILARVGIERGFEKFILFDEQKFKAEMAEKKVPSYVDIRSYKGYKSMVEDVIESFFGLLSGIIEKKYSRGASMEICMRIISAYYRSVKIDISYENIFDPITRLKELYQSKLRWAETTTDSNGRRYKTKYIEESVAQQDGYNIYTYKVFGWMNQKTITESGKKLIAQAEGWEADVAKNAACTKALEVLKKYGHESIPPAQK